MAAGDVIGVVPTSVANNAYLTLQPGAGVEWVIHNIYYGGAVTISKYDGTNDITVDTDVAAGARLNMFLHANNTHYFRIKNVSGGAIFIAYDGIQTK